MPIPKSAKYALTGAVLVLLAFVAPKFWAKVDEAMRCPAHGTIFLVNSDGEPLKAGTWIRLDQFYQGAAFGPDIGAHCETEYLDDRGSFPWRSDIFTVFATQHKLTTEGKKLDASSWQVIIK